MVVRETLFFFMKKRVKYFLIKIHMYTFADKYFLKLARMVIENNKNSYLIQLHTKYYSNSHSDN